MCTAKGEEIDRVVGFEVGADDYVVKPYSVRELVLRIRAQLRHRAQRAEGEPTRARVRPARDRSRRAPRVGRQGRGRADRARVQAALRVHVAARPRADARRAARPTSGASMPTSPRAPSTRTSSACARSSAKPASTSRRCAASAIDSRAIPTRPTHDIRAGRAVLVIATAIVTVAMHARGECGASSTAVQDIVRDPARRMLDRVARR